MTKRINKNKFINKFIDAAVVAIAISLASCGRVDTAPETGAAQFKPGLVAQPLPESSGASMAVADDDPAGVTLPMLVESRHFAIYSAYRMLFDDSPDVLRSRVGGLGEGLQQAVMTGDETMGGLPACSMRALLLRD